ncbi:MAG: M20/M25/M40 family metallo-hydrolase [Clostridia bacterium]|nr:M20/M25/M40 family metallo-hydrolase [Clostridia bacterium]
MDYQVSEKNRKLMETLLALPSVQKALDFLETEQDRSIEEQIEICLIESPTFYEQSRAEHYAEKLRESGLVQDVAIDEKYNVTGKVTGTTDEGILLEAHLDTVFPFGTVKEVRREGDTLYAPGIYDNARGIAVLLAALRALKHAGLTLKKNVIVAGSTREEFPGCGGGMRELLDRFPNVKAAISVDGGFINGINLSGKFSATVEYTFWGVGGHASNSFGKCANPLGAACRAVAALNDITLPTDPLTTFAAVQLRTPDGSGIPSSCVLRVNYTSVGKAAFEEMGQVIDRCVTEGCDKETARWGQDTIRFEKQIIGCLPGGVQDPHTPLIEAHFLASEALGASPFFRAGSSNGNISIERGIPATTVGSGTGNRKAHSVHELFCIEEAFRCPQGLFLLLLMAAGVDGVTPSCLDD